MTTLWQQQVLRKSKIDAICTLVVELAWLVGGLACECFAIHTFFPQIALWALLPIALGINYPLGRAAKLAKPA